jgi:ABC-type lipoprotein release transport system permease subunit
MISNLKLFNGKPLDDNIAYGVGLSTGLAEQLDLKLGSDLIAMASTVRGNINALDVQVYQLFESAVEILNDKLMFVPLKFAQSLYDTTSVDRLSVLLKDSKQTELIRAEFARALAERGLQVDIKTWKELDPLYTKMLGALGSLLGAGLTIISRFLVNVIIQPSWVPPIMTRRIPLEVYLVPEYLLYSTVFLILLSVGAAILPARRAVSTRWGMFRTSAMLS